LSAPPLLTRWVPIRCSIECPPQCCFLGGWLNCLLGSWCLWLLIKLVCFGFFLPAEVLTGLLTCITNLDMATFLQNAVSLLVLNHMLSRTQYLWYQISIVRFVIRYIFVVYLFGVIYINFFTNIFGQTLGTLTKECIKNCILFGTEVVCCSCLIVSSTGTRCVMTFGDLVCYL
jgi:hypothetical protein